MIILRYFVLVVLTTTLTSCGGGSGSSNNESAGGSGSSNNESADGFWLGFITDSEGTSSPVEFLSSAGKFIARSIDRSIVSSGQLNIRGNKLTSTNAKLYENNGQYQMDLEIDGVVNTKSKIMADVIDAEFGEKSTLSLDYEVLLEESTTYSDLSGSWMFTIDGPSYMTVIDNNGAFSFEHRGCIISGKVSIPNNMQSIILAEFTVSGEDICPKGKYDGLGLFRLGLLSLTGVDNEYAVSLVAGKIGE